jgi:hypothetical protein
MKRIVLAAFVLFAGLAGAAAAQDLPYGESLVFAAFRNGQPIGSHRLSFDRQGDQLVVTTSIDLAVKMLGLTAYRYSHRSRETWNGNDLQSVESSTDDDGKRYALSARREGGRLLVQRQAPGAAAASRAFLAADILPSTHWNIRQTSQPSLLNSQKGTVDRIGVETAGREVVRTAAGSIEATRYRYQGDVRMDQWFDARGRWVKLAFTASDGSVIEYVLQE